LLTSSRDFYCTGWINPLPAQEGIPGWKRMTMMKYFLDNDNNFDLDALWAYEGIVLPGGQIIVGRWWSPEDPNHTAPEDTYCGPFILWNTDCEAIANAHANPTIANNSSLFG
jgi:hypothetical protein